MYNNNKKAEEPCRTGHIENNLRLIISHFGPQWVCSEPRLQVRHVLIY